ncbi:MAG: molybdopterin biosynthesis protein [Methylobacteriaceae bacterium]|nr:molybdopterin biosynthesis protein [Methylobacteriaceae bacterium]
MSQPPPFPLGTSARAVDQEQFLTVVSRDEAIARFETALRPAPLSVERVDLPAALGRVVARAIAAPVDAPPFDRATVDGFAVQAADLAAAAPGRPARLTLNPEIVAAGVEPRRAVAAGTATPIATGGPIPRGADAVAMIEHTDPEGTDAIVLTRALAPGQNIAFAGSDIARGQTLLHAGTVIGSREIGMLAAVGLAAIEVWRKPRVAVISTGDELLQPGETLRPAAIYDTNGPIVAAAVMEDGCDVALRIALPDDVDAIRAALREAHAACDVVILSGGTSKGAGDLTYRLIGELGAPGVLVHGVALKPGKPLCLAVCDGKPVVALPGFPTSAMFTFHDIVAPALRRMAGLPPRQETEVEATLPVRAPSELGRAEFVMVALARAGDGLVAHPVGKSSGAVTAFAQADGFFSIDALSDAAPAGARVRVRLFSPHLRIPDLVIAGSHCVGLDAVAAALADAGVATRILALGSLGGLAALKRGECDIAPIHLLDPASGAYNAPLLTEALRLIPGWRRLQGVVFRKGDARFEGRAPAEAVAAALADSDCVMVNRNQGAGTRALIDGLLAGARPKGFWNQPRAHNAVAAAIAQGRADWGVAIRPAAAAFDLGFLPLADEHYDFAVSTTPADPAALAAFEAALAQAAPAIRALGFTPAGET